MNAPRPRLIILSQVYVPDPASVGQHLHDFAAEMVRRGTDVIVYCSSRGYDDPTQRYQRDEIRDGVRIHRYSLPFFSKTNMLIRIAGSAWAMLALLFNAMLTRNLGCIFFSTSPPLIGFLATIVARLKGVPRVYWAMDLNPDQLVQMGKLKSTSLVYRVLEGVNKFVIRHASLTIALDRFMEERLRSSGREPGEILVMPPWPHEDVETPLSHAQNWFRDKHNLQGRFVIMYSGNHTPANPLDTLLEAMKRFAGDDGIRFAFIGGGMGKKQVNAFIEQHKIANALSLPYQPIGDLRFSLSAADVHVVSLGQEMVGVIHPCKVYGSMAVGRPILFLGPKPSHVSDLIDAHEIGWHVAHGDIDACERAIRAMRATAQDQLASMGDRAQRAMSQSLSEPILNGRMCDAVERVMGKAKV